MADAALSRVAGSDGGRVAEQVVDKAMLDLFLTTRLGERPGWATPAARDGRAEKYLREIGRILRPGLNPHPLCKILLTFRS